MTQAKKRMQGKIGLWVAVVLTLAVWAAAPLRAVTLTTVEGTMYRADGSVASGTLLLGWPAFTTAQNEAVAAGSLTVTVGASGWVHVNLAANAGATPAGTYYTAVLHLSDGTTSREYWVVPAGAAANVGSVRAQLMPATVAVQPVSKQYVDSAVAAVGTAFVPTAGGAMRGPLTLSGDPSVDLQAATKHYADSLVGSATSAAEAAQAAAQTAQSAAGGAQSAAQLAQSVAVTAQAAAASAVRKSGDAMTGPLTLAGDPTGNLQAATKQYVDAHAGGSANNVDAGAYGQVPAYNAVGTDKHIGPTPEFVALGSLQSAVTAAAAVGGTVKIPANYTGTDTFTNPNGIPVVDLRTDVPVNARNVKEFGARCDGVTDDTAAIQAAFDWVNAHGGEVSFPAGTCITGTINWHGEGFGGISSLASVVLGKQGQDVFAVPDKADGPVSLQQGGRVHDITVIEKPSPGLASTSAWAAKLRGAGQGSIFANDPTGAWSGVTDANGNLTGSTGWAGQKVKGPVGAADTSIPLTTSIDLTNYHLGYAPWGWIKIGTEYIYYNGLAATGCPNSAPMCLLNAQRGITLAGTATTAATHADGEAVVPVNPNAPSDTIDPFPAWQIANCAFAFQNRDGNNAVQVFDLKFDHVIIKQWPYDFGNTSTYQTCGFYFQYAPYNVTMDTIDMPNGEFPQHGIAIAPPSIHEDAPIAAAYSGDGNKWTRLFIHAAVPFSAWIGGKNAVSNSDLYINASVDQQGVGVTTYPGVCPIGSSCAGKTFVYQGWSFDNVSSEPNNGNRTVASYPPFGQLVGGFGTSGMSPINTSDEIGHAGWVTAPYVIDSSGSAIEVDMGNCSFTHYGLVVTGNSNKFTGNIGCLKDTGVGNTYGPTGFQYSPAQSYKYPTYDVPGKASLESLDKGYTGPDQQYLGLSSLFITPERTQSAFGGVSSLGTGIVNDVNAPLTQKAVLIPASSQQGILFKIDSQQPSTIVIGKQLPLNGKGVLHAMMRASVATTLHLRLAVNGGTPWAGVDCSIGTTYGDCQLPFDTTGLASGTWVAIDSYGSAGSPCGSGPYCPNPAADIWVAWFAFVPNTKAINSDQVNADRVTANSATLGVLHAFPGTGGFIGAIDSTQTGIGIDGVSYGSYPAAGGYLLIDSEIVSYTGTYRQGDGGTGLAGVVRGALGTAAASHVQFSGITLLSPLILNSSGLPVFYCAGNDCSFGSGLKFGTGGFGGSSAGVWNAAGYQVNGAALASTHLSDTSALARLNQANTWTGAQSFGAVSAQSLALGAGTAITSMRMYSASLTPTAVVGQSCSDQSFTVTGLAATDRISQVTPPAALGNVSLNAWASATNTLMLHFCNPGEPGVTPPSGTYSFLAAH